MQTPVRGPIACALTHSTGFECGNYRSRLVCRQLIITRAPPPLVAFVCVRLCVHLARMMDGIVLYAALLWRLIVAH